MSFAHWSSLDRQMCIVSYSDTIVSMQYLYDVFTVFKYGSSLYTRAAQFGDRFYLAHALPTVYIIVFRHQRSESALALIEYYLMVHIHS